MKISNFMKNCNLEKSQEAINYMALLMDVGDQYYDRRSGSMILDPDEYAPTGLVCTYAWIGTNDGTDEAEVHFQDIWEEGHTVTGIGSLGASVADFTNEGYLVI